MLESERLCAARMRRAFQCRRLASRRGQRSICCAHMRAHMLSFVRTCTLTSRRRQRAHGRSPEHFVFAFRHFSHDFPNPICSRLVALMCRFLAPLIESREVTEANIDCMSCIPWLKASSCSVTHCMQAWVSRPRARRACMAT